MHGSACHSPTSLVGAALALAASICTAHAASVEVGGTATIGLYYYLCSEADTVTPYATIRPSTVVPPNGNLNGATIVFNPPTVTVKPGELHPTVLSIQTAPNSRAGTFVVRPRGRGTNANCSTSYDQSETNLTVRPRVLPNNAAIWWFNDEKPADYPRQILVTAQPSNSGPYSWKIELGEGWAVFGNDSTTMTTDVPKVLLKASGSPPAMAGDIQVSVRANGVTSGPAVVARVLAPFKIVPGAKTQDWPDSLRGYRSVVHYRILDQFDNVLPHDIAVNEHFTNPTAWPPPLGAGVFRDMATSNWVRGPEAGGIGPPDNLTDTISGCTQGHGWNGLPDTLPNNPCRPVPFAHTPGTPYSKKKVDHWCGEISVGHAQAGRGVKVAKLVWQRYWDHGRHCDLQSPANLDPEQRLFPCQAGGPIC